MQVKPTIHETARRTHNLTEWHWGFTKQPASVQQLGTVYSSSQNTWYTTIGPLINY